MKSPTDILLSIIILTMLSISIKLSAAEVADTQDESFFLFIADMSADEQSLDPLAMLAFEEDVEKISSSDKETTTSGDQTPPTNRSKQPTNKIEPSLVGEKQP